MAKIKFFIPRVGTRLKLTKPWSFGLYSERRNDSMLEAVGREPARWSRDAELVEGVTLPVGTTLVVSRVYVRSGNSSLYDSITFRVEKGCPHPQYNKCRFWVKLVDANTIECEVNENWLE
jgi:hypothetical protein